MLWRDLRTVQIFGANTNVGKSVVSTLLCKAFRRKSPRGGVSYLKPVSTGPAADADTTHISRFASGVISENLLQFRDPVSPHLAARRAREQLSLEDGRTSDLTDSTILEQVRSSIQSSARDGVRYLVLETAGGPLSPGPSGTLQADLYRPLRLPVSLVGDHRLGGIGSTISAFESLHVRGYDVDSIVMFEDKAFANHEYLHDYFDKKGVKTFALSEPPARDHDSRADEDSMNQYYEAISNSVAINSLVESIDHRHHYRISKLTHMPALAESIIWHPFQQHAIPQNLLVIDSAYDDFFQGVSSKSLGLVQEGDPSQTSGITSIREGREKPFLDSLFDGSASWWTQGLGHGNPDLALTAAHAAGRYGHVMFASAIHASALDLATSLLSLLANPRLSRVFYSDNGSTGVEVALKMALRSSSQRYGWTREDDQVGVLGLKGSYHGDCIATMNCSEPSTFNETVNWYKPWGWWFDPPSLKMVHGVWILDVSSEMGVEKTEFTDLPAIFDFEARSHLGHTRSYEAFITSTLDRLIKREGRKFGALICEPILMGAGGMTFVDPLFQRTLIKVVRQSVAAFYADHHTTDTSSSSAPDSTSWSGLPVIADEVFTGLYRLGRASSSSYLSAKQSAHHMDVDVAPDISIHAKLLSGGLLPLAVTTSSESIFNTFLSDKKQDALLHGHSYTGHAVGCSVAEKSLAIMRGLEKDGAWREHQVSWQPSPKAQNAELKDANFWSFWSQAPVKRLSESSQVEGVFALGSVLAIHMKTGEGAGGYTSNAAAELQGTLLRKSEGGFGVHSRVLGNVLYLMASMTSKRESIAVIEKTLMRALV